MRECGVQPEGVLFREYEKQVEVCPDKVAWKINRVACRFTDKPPCLYKCSGPASDVAAA